MIVDCANCGKPFARRCRQNHCSPTCAEEFRVEWFAKQTRRARRESLADPSRLKNCPHCKANFKDKTIRNNKTYCSRKCAAKADSARDSLKRQQGRAHLRCIVCAGKLPKLSRRVCSDECRAARTIAQRKTDANRIYNALYHQAHRFDSGRRARAKERVKKWKQANGERAAWIGANVKRTASKRPKISFEDWQRLRMIRAAKRALKAAKPEVFDDLYGSRQTEMRHRRYFTDSKFRQSVLDSASLNYQKRRKPKLQLLWGAYKFFRSIDVLPPIEGGAQKAQAARLALTEAAKAGITLPPELAALVRKGSIIGVSHAA